MLDPEMLSAAVLLLNVSWALALGGAKDRKLLHSALFDNYTTSVRPCLDYSRPTNVTAKLNVGTIMGLDIKNQVLSINGFISFKWRDELLTWNPDDYGGIKDMVVPQGIIWKPDMAVYNSLEDDIYLGGENLLADVNFKGEVRWEPGINLDATCQVDISQYPFDVNVCRLEVTSWMNDNSSVVLLLADEPIRMSGSVTNSQFWITADGAEILVDDFADKFYSTIYFHLKLKRRPAYLAMTLMMPITMLAIMCAVPYLLSPSEPEKLMVAITVLLSFTVIMDFISGRIPQNSEHVSILVIYMTLLFIQSFLSVVFNAIVLIVNILDERPHSPRHINKDITTSEVVHFTEQTTPSKKRLVNFLLGHGALWKMCSKFTAKINPPSQDQADKPKTMSRAYILNKVFLVINIFSLLATSLVSWILLVS